MIQSRPATPESFAPYGMVVGTPVKPPTSSGPEYTFWSDLAHYNITGETEIGLCTVFRQSVENLSGLERHLMTPEILVPADGPFVVPLLLEGEPPSAVRAFRVETGEAIVINPGVWHGACLPVDKDRSTYFVIFRRGTPGTDVEKCEIDPIAIHIDR